MDSIARQTDDGLASSLASDVVHEPLDNLTREALAAETPTHVCDAGCFGCRPG